MGSMKKDESNFLTGQLLIAMPDMSDPRFTQSVIFICEHNEEGAMGLVINKKLGEVTLKELLTQVGKPPVDVEGAINIHFGGPVETEKGFMLHSTDTTFDNSLLFNNNIALTATTDILRHMAHGEGPAHSVFVLGYAGWEPDQLEDELKSNAWLTTDADADLLFRTNNDDKWKKALAKLGITPEALASIAGNA